ncbi:MAG: hypothetical protein QG646_1300, partial [Euryarchaeota archaeon]|nr:hypothetical protein [Euryarchaeota archaeon]
ITKTLELKGFKEGIDYKSSGGKIEFKLIDEKGVETYDTGIEAFTHGKESTDIIKLPTKGETDIELSSPSLKASAGKSEIAFGYNSQKPLSIEGGKLKIQTLQEQMSRKIAGSTMYKTGKLEPAHKNRIKDPLDVITMGTAFAVKDKVPIEKDLVTFTNAAFEKWGGKSKDPFSAAFNEKVASDPLVKFIHEKQRLPSETEATEFKIELAEIFQPEIFSNRAAKGSPLPVTSGSPFPSPSPRSRSPLPVTSGSPSPSPSPHSRSPSPVTFGSPSPSPSPVTFGSPSPSPSPVTFGSPSPSPSPVTSGSPSPSPSPSYRSPSTVHIMDPNPKNKKRKVDLPNSKETQKSVSIVALNGWSSRVKQHYVQDPFSLVLGGGKRKK